MKKHPKRNKKKTHKKTRQPKKITHKTWYYAKCLKKNINVMHVTNEVTSSLTPTWAQTPFVVL